MTEKNSEVQKNPALEQQDTRCSYFWSSVCIRSNGRLVPCCMYDDMKDAPNLRDFSGDLEQAYNSELFQEMRRKSLSGEPIAGCENCYFKEQTTGKSMRKKANEEWSDSFDSITSPLENVTFAEFFVGNVCNLKCSMCDPRFSTLLAKDYHKLGWVSEDVTKPFENDFRSTLQKLPNLNKIKFVGGEPLVNKAHWELLESITEEQARRICLEYATNCTIFPNDKQLQVWSKFRSLEIFLSIDGMGSTTEYIRYPSKWNKIQENAKKYDALLLDKPQSFLGLNCVVSVYNIFNLTEFVNWCEANLKGLYDLYGNSTLIFSCLVYPEHLNIKHLPQSVKNELLDRYPSNEIFSYIRGFLEEPGEPEKLKKFKTHTENFDRIRKISYMNYIPELEPLMTQI